MATANVKEPRLWLSNIARNRVHPDAAMPADSRRIVLVIGKNLLHCLDSDPPPLLLDQFSQTLKNE
jgi:hypothetical protein